MSQGKMELHLTAALFIGLHSADKSMKRKVNEKVKILRQR